MTIFWYQETVDQYEHEIRLLNSVLQYTDPKTAPNGKAYDVAAAIAGLREKAPAKTKTETPDTKELLNKIIRSERLDAQPSWFC